MNTAEGNTEAYEAIVMGFLFTQVDDLTRENTKLLEERDQARKKLIEPKDMDHVRAVFDGQYIKFVNQNHSTL